MKVSRSRAVAFYRTKARSRILLERGLQPSQAVVVLYGAQGSGLPPQLETRGDMPAALVIASGSTGGYAGTQSSCASKLSLRSCSGAVSSHAKG